MSSNIDPNEFENVTRMPKVHCPICGEKLDAASPAEGQGTPGPGDVSVCFYCTAFLVFGEDMAPELMSEETYKALDRETLAELSMIRSLIKGQKQQDLH